MGAGARRALVEAGILPGVQPKGGPKILGVLPAEGRVWIPGSESAAGKELKANVLDLNGQVRRRAEQAACRCGGRAVRRRREGPMRATLATGSARRIRCKSVVNQV